MKFSTVDLLYCIECRSSLKIHMFEQLGNEIKEGVLMCTNCNRWYPITNYIVNMLPCSLISKVFFDNFRLHNEKNFKLPEIVPEQKNSIKNKQIEFYDKDSKCYEDLVVNHRFWRVSDRNTIHRWIKELKTNFNVLDIGCGTGRCTKLISCHVKNVIGIDISFNMLRKAHENICNDKIFHKIDYIQADAENLPFKANTFEYCNLFGILHHVESAECVLKEIKRVLSHNGYFYALENNKTILRGIFDYLMKKNRLWNELGGKEPLLNIKNVKKLCKKIGLKVSINTSTFLPPHLFEYLTEETAYVLLTSSDWFFLKIPYLRNLGGQLIIKGEKPFA